MSGVEIVSLVASVISILEASRKAYEKLQDIHELPQVFRQVVNKPPLVLQTL